MAGALSTVAYKAYLRELDLLPREGGPPPAQMDTLGGTQEALDRINE